VGTKAAPADAISRQFIHILPFGSR